MRQIFLGVLFFSFFKALADPGHGLEANYNGRTFSCESYEDAKQHVEEFGEAPDYYNYALCRLHRGELSGGITSLETALEKGDPYAAVLLADYHVSDFYALGKGKTTKNLIHLKTAIGYYEKAFGIMSRESYPFDSDHLRIEREEFLYLMTANNLVRAYKNQFAFRYNRQVAGGSARNDTSTLESLSDMKAGAEKCLAIAYRETLWSEKTYNHYMKYCQMSLDFLKDRPESGTPQGLRSLETERLRIAVEECHPSVELSDCPAHKAINEYIEAVYAAHLDDLASR